MCQLTCLTLKRTIATSLGKALFFAGITVTANGLILGQTAEFTQGAKTTNIASLNVPLMRYPGRAIDLPVSLSYSSKVWRIGFIKSVTIGSSVWQGTAEAIYAEHSTAGWTTSLDVPKIEWPKPNDVYWYDGKPYPRGTVSGWTYRVAKVFIHMPDGSIHELRKFDQVYADTGSVDMSGTFYAVDGSRLRYDSTGATTGTLYLPNGIRYVFGANTVDYIDTNGNTLSYNISNRQWTDTMGRVIGMPWPTNPQAGTDYQYLVPGQNGGTITFTIKFKSLSNVLTPGSASLRPVGDFYLPNPNQDPTNWTGNNFPQATQGASMFTSGYSDPDESDIQSYSRIVGRGQVGSNVFNPVVLSEVVLPNGLSYVFTYNNYGELDKVVYPSGSYERYQYAQIASLGDVKVPYQQGSRGMTSRWLSANGSGNDEINWQYTTTKGSSVLVLGVTSPGVSGAANGLRTETHLLDQWVADPKNFGLDNVVNGMPVEERIYAPASEGGTMLRRTLTDWDKSQVSHNYPSPGTGHYSPTRNPRLIKTVALFLDTGGDALTSMSTFSYDTSYQFTVGVERTGTSEYAFTTVNQTTAQTGAITAMPQGAFFRSTNATYLTGNANYRNRNILGVANSSSISDSGGVVAQSAMDFDEGSFPLLTYGTVTGWTDPQTNYRANPTTVWRWLNYPTSQWLASHTQYDQCGNVRKMWAPNDTELANPAQVEYSPTYHYAYATAATSAIPDPDGVYGQTTGLVSTSVFDFNTGLLLSSTDPNGRTTTYEYNDPLNRIRKVNLPDGGWTTTDYGDTPGSAYVKLQTLQHTSPTLQVMESYQYLDRLGRTIRTFVNEGSTYLTSDTQYDALGRVLRVSNPYRTTSRTDAVNPTNLWSTNSYDTRGRITAATTSDSAHVDTEYGYSLTSGYPGITVTGKDQTGKTRKSITDAFGRVIQVIEDPNSAALQSNYTYDVQDNLRRVEQGTQLRYFGYNSLSQVIRVRQVEQTVNTSLAAWTDPVTGWSGGWTAAFTYDNNGNQLTRTDARNITTTLTYDQLNRVTSARYSNDPQGTPGVDTYYDGYRANAYTSIANVKGRVWQTETLNQAKVTIDNYDVMGRPTIQRQQFWANNAWSGSYQTSASYDLSGGLVSQTYPSGHTVTYEADQLGRVKSVAGNLGDGVSRTYASNFQYNEFGVLQQEQFGTQTPLYHKQRYNSRGQLWDMRLSTVSYASDPDNGDRGSIVNHYSSNYSQGGSGTDNNGQLLRQESYVPGGPYFQQTYAYDNLKRLNSVSEKLNGTGSDSFKQVYIYDRWGNRTVDQTQSSSNVPRPTYTIDSSTNRLVAPAGYNYGYDNAGNQINDTYTGGGQRVYDAENHLISAQESSGWHYYKYSGSGLRVRRLVNGGEDWLVYGIGGALIAEYRAGAASFAPVKEYCYRGGQLLTSVANGDHRRLSRFVDNLYYGALQRDATAQEKADRMNELTAAGAQGQTQLYAKAAEIAGNLFALTTYETSPSRTDSQFVSDLYYAYLHRAPDDGGLSFWTPQAAGSVPNRTYVHDQFAGSAEFQTLVSTLFGTSTSDNERTEHFVNNFYLGALGRNATSTELQQQRDRLNAASAVSAATVQGEAEEMGRELLASQVTNTSISDAQYVTNLYEAFLHRGPDAIGLSYWIGEAAGGSTRRQNVLNAFATCGPFRDLAATLYREVFWLVSDQLGTPRIIVDKSGSLASVRRHDYLPFGEQIGSAQVALIGGRDTTPGYVSDSIRQKFTGYESDAETGLYFAQARYQSGVQGRFTSVDPLGASASVGNPQSFNRYSYVENNPLNAIDPTGLALSDVGIYQTSDPATARELEQKSAQGPTPKRKNPTLPKPRKLSAILKNVPLPPGPSGTVPTAMTPIDVGPAPLMDGEEPWPTELVITQAPNKTYNGDPVVSPSGEVMDSDPNYGVGRTVDYTIKDQGGNPMGPASGVRHREQVRPDNAHAQALWRYTEVQDSFQAPDSRGIVPDTLGFITPWAGIVNFLNQNQVDATYTQTITVLATVNGEYRTALTMTNSIRATNSGATLTLGPITTTPRPK